MTPTNTLLTDSPNKRSLIKAMLIGGGIGLLIILFFITGTQTQPHWPELWKIRPLIITPLAAALGGGLAYITTCLHKRKGIHTIIAVIISLFGFMIALWMGIVVGLDGTLWD